MKLARIEYRGTVCRATVTCSGYFIEGPAQFGGTSVSEDEVALLPPVVPGKIIGVGWNFREHIREMVARSAGERKADEKAKQMPPPLFFLKPPSSLIGHRQAIIYPRDATRVEHEGELGVVIGKEIRRVTPEEAAKAVMGWTCANDVTERHQQAQDKQWWRAKGYDTFAVAGPYIETEAPSSETWIRTRVNGELRQAGQVADMIRDPYTIISVISQAMTLQRGDLIMLGTPPGVGELRPGDEVEVEIDEIGYLRNPVVMEPD
ncbi:MAG: fumarylacetoacetate hydrolase family protein [Actinobacteria bacterium]|jgi:2-keto-4-pentenoate hydratase/2-oxohepta-3-ene-1,7-dioic acid hydratase in catechol pathway|nr:fumarylacetoacetate hydrolase family protein [Actinomycetota bacterium]